MRFGCGDGSMENKKRYPPFSCQMRIDKALSEAVHLPLNSCSRYIIISDCHRGEGGANDNFLRNQHLYMAALNYYIAHGFTYFELGDGRVIRMSTAGLKHCRNSAGYTAFTEITIWK